VLVTREVQVIETNLLLRFTRVRRVNTSRVVVSITSHLLTLLNDLRQTERISPGQFLLLTAEANLAGLSLALISESRALS
jgi:hypothetical protein